MSYPHHYELYKRVDQPSGAEKYEILETFSEKPSSDDVNNAFLGKPRYLMLTDCFLILTKLQVASLFLYV